MRKFVIKFGSYIVDIMAFVTIAGLIVSTIKVMGAQGVWAGLTVLWAGLVSFVFVFFLMYLAISINEKMSDRCIDTDDRYQNS